jgi:amidohydrolase
MSQLSTTADDIRGSIEEILDGVIALRHELHAHPEIRFQEKWTSDRIAAFLDGIGVPYERGYAKGTGIVATLRGADGPTVALRADIDALEIQEETGLPYASRIPNRMHACGHDGHSAVLCGVASVLARRRDALPGAVKFIFQPAEEIAAGGRYIVEEGALDDADAAFALHGWPTLPAGHIGVRDGCMLAGAQDFYVTVRGKGCHGADPGSGVDPIVVAAHIITALQTVVSREVDPTDPAVVTVGELTAGQSTNIIPETARLRGTMRSVSPHTMKRIADAVERIATGTAAAFRGQAEVTYGPDPYPPLHNDPAMTNLMRETVRDVLGPEKLLEVAEPTMGAEDFAFYLHKVPGTFVFLGVKDPAQETHPPLHNARYDFNDRAVAPAIEVMSQVALRCLERLRG